MLFCGEVLEALKELPDGPAPVVLLRPENHPEGPTLDYPGERQLLDRSIIADEDRPSCAARAKTTGSGVRSG